MALTVGVSVGIAYRSFREGLSGLTPASIMVTQFRLSSIDPHNATIQHPTPRLFLQW
jgi:hypothetical protein